MGEREGGEGGEREGGREERERERERDKTAEISSTIKTGTIMTGKDLD